MDDHVAYASSSRTCPAVEKEQDTCLLLMSPSAANPAAGASHNFTAEEKTGRARSETPTNDSDDSDMGSILAGFLTEPTDDPTDDNYNGMAESILAGVSPDPTHDNDVTGSSIPVGLSPAIASSTAMFVRPNVFQTLSLVGEEEEEEEEEERGPGLFLSRIGTSRSSPLNHGFAFPPPPARALSAAAVHTISLADGLNGAAPEIVGYGSGDVFDVDGGGGGDPRSDSSGVDSFLFESDEDKDEDEDAEDDDDDEDGEVDKSLPLPVPAVVASAEEERADMTTRLVEILRGLDDRHVAIRGEYLARFCSLSRCEDNSDLTWLDVLGEGKFGRVSLVEHELGRYAVKELMGVSIVLVLISDCNNRVLCCTRAC